MSDSSCLVTNVISKPATSCTWVITSELFTKGGFSSARNAISPQRTAHVWVCTQQNTSWRRACGRQLRIESSVQNVILTRGQWKKWGNISTSIICRKLNLISYFPLQTWSNYWFDTVNKLREKCSAFIDAILAPQSSSMRDRGLSDNMKGGSKVWIYREKMFFIHYC